MEQFNLAISNSYGYIETFPIPLDATDEDVAKIVEDYVQDFKDKLNVFYLCRYEVRKNSWNHRKYKDRAKALEFVKPRLKKKTDKLEIDKYWKEFEKWLWETNRINADVMTEKELEPFIEEYLEEG
jgi:hypothetical protein